MSAQHIHMIGIGGIGISALAQLYVHQGLRVSGTNDEQSPKTLDHIRALGVPISLDISVASVPKDVDMFVYSDAWPARVPEYMEAVRALGKPMFSYFEALGRATATGTSIVITGTHGKTTTTAMLAKVLIDTGQEPTVIAGSILSEYGSNFVAGKPDLFVVEGCEYMRHFLHLHPTVLVINNIELDHTDYYRDLEDMQDAFHAMVSRVPQGGCIVTNTDQAEIRAVLHGAHETVVPYQEVSVPTLRTPGQFNQSNARAAKVAALAYNPDLAEAEVDRALADFSGTWRRFEYKGVTEHGAVVYDDYAHHPTAMQNTIEMVRTEFPEKKLVVVFHPHLYSRTKQFFEQFVNALTLADMAYVLPVYAAREQEDVEVRSENMARAISAQGGAGHFVDSFSAVQVALAQYTSDTLVLTMGAGDVFKVADAVVTGA